LRERGLGNAPVLAIELFEKRPELLTLQLMCDRASDEPGETARSDAASYRLGEIAWDTHGEFGSWIGHA
jgi:hypothetical protein